MKILLLDIENTPNLAWIWSARQEYTHYRNLVQEREILCAAWKWYGEDYTYWVRGAENAAVACQEVMSEADAVIHFNGNRHDIPILNQKMVELGLDPPPDSKQIDLIHTIRQRFNFYSNSLTYVLEKLGLPGKEEHDGFQTWLDCMNPHAPGHKRAWRDMERYNRQDVVIMEPLYERLLPWIKNHPNQALYSGTDCCPRCGSGPLRAQGHRYTQVGKFPRFKCDSCGGWSTSGKSVGRSDRR